MKITDDEERELFNASESHYRVMAEGDRLFRQLAIVVITAGILSCAFFIFIAVR
jgi:hypothetical protein